MIMTWLRRFLVTTACVLAMGLGMLAAPQPTYAQAPDVVAALAAKEALDKILNVLKNAALIGTKNALSAFLGKLSYDAAVFIASAGTGQESLVYAKPPGEYFADLGDAAAGGLIEGLATSAGLDAAGLCDPGDNFKINLSIGLETNIGQPSVYEPACTLTKLAGNWREAYSDPRFSDFVALQFDSTANPLGISLEAENATIIAVDEAELAAQLQRAEDEGGFRAKQEQVSKTILTPASVIQEQKFGSDRNAAWYTLQSTDNPVVEALNIFTSTLISKLMERAQKGIANLTSGSQLSGLLGGEFSGTVSGRAAAEAVYAELRQPVFGSSGSFDVLSELAACPSEVGLRATNNCAIGAAMQTAIQDGWTVQEFVDFQATAGQSFLFANDAVTTQQIQNSEGINQTGIALLKKYRVIPVGWQVAADYVANSSDAPTLKQLADCYNYCGVADPERSCDFVLLDDGGAPTAYSPYCQLVDPYWVLKAPQNFCEREAPGEVIVESDNLDTDANSNTQESIILSRLNYCADTRGCIQEEQEGVCTAYGYCTEEERIYRFDGDICEPEYSSCATFTDTNGNDVSLLKSSLNYNDCATDPGCQWYCASQNAAGEFDCASPTETYVSCAEAVTENEADYGLSYDVSYDSNEVCACTSTQTCQVAAGSTSGDGDGDGLLDYRECLVNNTDVTGATISQSVCTLTDNCGASNSSYNAATSTCTCSITLGVDVPLDANHADITVDDATGGNTTHTCVLTDSCSSSSATYTTAPVCSVAAAGLLNCGEACTTTSGGSCTNSLGNTCTDGSSSDSDPAAGVCVLADSCTIADGLFSCTSAAGNLCILGTIAEQPAVQNDTIYFDENVGTCDSSDTGCNQYIRIRPDTNLIPNALFDYYDTDQNALNDIDGGNDSVLQPTVNGDDLAFCTHNGSGCATDANCVEDLNGDGDGLDANEAAGECVGWIQNGTTAYVLDGDFSTALSPDIGTNFIQLDPVSTAGTLEATVGTGHRLANRTFTFAYRARALTTCTDVAFTIGSSDGSDVSAAVTAGEYTTAWQNYTTTYTFADTTADTAITVAISASTSCPIYIGAAQLTETDTFSDSYSNYAVNNVTYLNGDTVSCEPADVGCELYVEDGRSEEDGIPGLITNPASDACVDADGNYNYDNPECNQCNGDPAQDQPDDYYAGCDFYQEVELNHTAPLTSDETWLTAEQRAGVMRRSGSYCAGDSTTHCFVDADCASGACVPQTSVVPASAEQCSVAAVGCEEYTNLASVDAGGEGVEYYTSLKQCVRRDDQTTAVYYTFAGSDSTGVQVQDHTLKVNPANQAPCTQLDLSSEDFNAACADTSSSVVDCGPDGDIDGDGVNNTADVTTDAEEYGTNADCRQYVNGAGDIFYRYESHVIVASDDCTPLRNTMDTRVYFALPEQSNRCTAAQVSCREYKGTNSGSEEDIINEGFGDNSTELWVGATSTSNESVLQSGYSLQLHNADTSDSNNDEISYALFIDEGSGPVGLLDDGKSYVLTFWAKADDGGTLSASLVDQYFTDSGASSTPATITLDPNNEDGWQFYAVGPVILPVGANLDDGDEYFRLQYTGTAGDSAAYIDTIVLSESNSQYLIQDSGVTCNNFEGCRLYEDRAGTDHYLKSFQRLCADTAVGCEAMIQTQNSSHPFTEAYNLDNEYDQDDVIVPADQTITQVYNEDNECSSTAMGCTEFGLPAVDDRTGEISDYQPTYLLNLPDEYSSTLCEQPQLACRQYTSEYDGTVYFKDPGEKLCELKEYSTGSNTYNGWFKLDSEATTPDCPLQYDFSAYAEVYASQPLGGVCNSNSIKTTDSGTDDKVGALCNSDADCYPLGWASGDPRPRCISSFDDDVDVRDGGVHNYVVTEDDGVTLADRVDDFGWAGICPEDQSGCSEYIDPYSPNIEELNRNWSFEHDVRDDSNVYYSADAEPTGFPDFWTITDCDTSAATITSVSGDAVTSADGASAVRLGGGCTLEQASYLTRLQPDKTYSLQGQVKLDPALFDTAEFSIGIHFYTNDGDDADSQLDLIPVDDLTQYPVADHATITAEDGRDTDNLTYWYRFQAQVGLGTTVPIPTEPTLVAARVFITNHAGSDIYFDAVSFKEVDKYYYLDYTVDGTSEREQLDGTNTCINQDTDEASITSDGGCVAFRDTTSDTQNYAQDGLDCTTCLLTPNSDSCRYIVDACDTNSVLAVKKDRVCSEWIACETAGGVESENGTMISQCFAINRCVALDEDGNCAEWLPKPGYDEISSSTDLHYTSAAGDADELAALRNLTGYAKVGVTWNNVLYCSGGPNDGVRCNNDATCADSTNPANSGTCRIPFTTEGYYPYGWMPEVGESGASTGADLIELPDFEQLYCAGDSADTSLPCILNADSNGNPGHCYSNALKQKVDSDTTAALTYDDFVYVDSEGSNTGEGFDPNADRDLAFCPNSPSFGDTFWPFGSGAAHAYTLNGWQPLGEASSIFVTQYQDYQDCPAPCSDIDLNNVLQVGSDSGTDAFAGGVSYDLQDNITVGGTYALSFDARYVSDFNSVAEGSTPSTVSICLNHSNIADAGGNPLVRKDCFASGFGQTDIVFAIDTSSTMATEISAVALAVPALAEQLTSAGIDARFALVDMDDNDTSDSSQLGNHIDLDFTNNTDDFREGVLNMRAEDSNVDPSNAIYQVANNNLFGGEALSFRANARKFLVVVTDTGDEITNGIGLSDAEAAAVAANLPVFVLTTQYSACADDDTNPDPCTDFYSEMAEATGGAAYGYDDTDHSTFSDWAANTTIVDDLFSSIIDAIDIFQFTTELETYTLGPITVTAKAIDAAAGEQYLDTPISQLEFLGSDGFAFQLDNVSLLPVLEVNQDLNPIGRSCRAYPESDSRQCSYVEQNGTQFRGWKGYCLEADPLNSDRCITWWPIDVLEGETSIVQRNPAGYSGRSAVYHCLVSKGLEHPGFCNEEGYNSVNNAGTNDWGQGVICSSDATCSGNCFQGANYTLPNSNTDPSSLEPSILIEHNNLSDNYSEQFTTVAGQCEVIDDSDTSCHEWLDTGYCSDGAYHFQAECEAAGGTWNQEIDLLQNAAVLSTGDCVDITTGAASDIIAGFPINHYALYSDPQADSLTSDLYCFYDVDGEPGNEVRSTRSCVQDSGCQEATATAFDCASMACAGTEEESPAANISCSYHENETNSECQSADAAHTDVSYETRPLRWQMPDPAQAHYVPGFYTTNHFERGVIVRLPANEILRNIHASEMEVIEFNPGSAGGGAGGGNEYPFWGQLNGNQGDELTGYDSGEELADRGGVWLTDLLQGAIAFDADGNVVDKDNCYAYGAADQAGFGCRMWGLYDSNFLLENYDAQNLPQMDEHGLDLVYQWVWGNFDYGARNTDLDAPCNLDGGSPETDTERIFNLLRVTENPQDWLDSDCVDSSLRYIAGNDIDTDVNRNLWKNLEEEHPDLWNEFYVDYDTGATAGPAVVPFDGVTNQDVSGPMWPDEESSNDVDDATVNHGGGNILSVYVDFNDAGYIQAVYAMVYFAARGTDDYPWFPDEPSFLPVIVETTFQNMMHLDIQTRESCALVAESVDAIGTNFAWANRANEAGYEINYDDGTGYGLRADNEPYGSIDNQAGDPPSWDTFVSASTTTEWTDINQTWSTLGNQPAVAMNDEDVEVAAGHPLSCLGECDTTACVLNPDALGDACDADSCDSGICMGVGDPTISNEGQAAGYDNLTEQINAAVNADGGARDRLKHVFAGINSFYILDYLEDDGYAITGNYWADSSGDIFEQMPHCPNNERPSDQGSEAEYCGVYPSVTGLTINDEAGGNSSFIEVSNGQTVTLQFDSNVDGEQKPLDKIYIDWGDGSSPTRDNWEADVARHTYTHAYSCGPENAPGRYHGTYCDFTPKITLVDNWLWCSGQITGVCSDTAYSTEESCTDHTASWTSGGDHRYTDEALDVMQSCQSYDEPNLTIRVNATN